LLAGELIARGHAVRGTTRDPARRAAIEDAGAEPFVGDPDRVATLVPALDHVSVVYALLGSARGTPEQLTALHGTRLEMLLLRMVDSTARGIVYESSGSVDAAVLSAGRQTVRTMCERSQIGYVLLSDQSSLRAWLTAAVSAAEQVLA
jgi:uncharacterized protein YbjT (DUF2867 family)